MKKNYISPKSRLIDLGIEDNVLLVASGNNFEWDSNGGGSVDMEDVGEMDSGAGGDVKSDGLFDEVW